MHQTIPQDVNNLSVLSVFRFVSDSRVCGRKRVCDEDVSHHFVQNHYDVYDMSFMCNLWQHI